MATLCSRLETMWGPNENPFIFCDFLGQAFFLARLTVHIKRLKVRVLECTFIFTSTCRKAHNSQSLCQLVSWTKELFEDHARAAAEMFKSTCLSLLATSSVLTTTSATDAWQKIVFSRFFKTSWWKWEKAYICLVRSNHSRCNSWPLPGRQTPCSWRRKRPPRLCSRSPAGWISKIRTDGAAGCLEV